jgi:hypothetical protein
MFAMFRQTMSRIWNFLNGRFAVAAMVVLAIVLLPTRARSQFVDPCCAILTAGLNTISGLLKNVVAAPLGSIQQIQQQIASFEQSVVWPADAIGRARGMVVQAQGQFRQMTQLYRLPVASATLPAPQRLEHALLSANAQNVGQVSQNYTNLYGPVMAPEDAPQPVRDLVDMTDAEAEAAMKKAVEIDALADLELQAADQINQQLQNAAPGSAPILEAQTGAWLVRANAYTQSAMAELVRVRSVELANAGGQLKFSASHATNLRNAGSQILQRGAH